MQQNMDGKIKRQKTLLSKQDLVWNVDEINNFLYY